MAHLGNDAVMRAVASNRVMAFWGTLIGKKVVMAITGAILIGFVVADMIGNLKIFLGPDEIDAYSRFLREMGLPALGYGELLWIVRIVLLVCVALHVTAAIQLTRMSGAARPVGYNVKRDIESTFASRTMRWGGALLVVFIVLHLLDLTAGIVGFQPGQFGHLAVCQNVTAAFGQTGSTEGTSSPSPASEAEPVAAVEPAPAGEVQRSNDRLNVNPVTGQTTAQMANYMPLTADERWKLYLKQSYCYVGAYFGPLFAALVLDQASSTPPQWGGGFRGYGRRVVSRIASGGVQNSMHFLMAAPLKEDVRYIASSQHGFGHRLEHAVLYSFLTYNTQGHPTLNVANTSGYYGAAAVSTLWIPGERQKVLGCTLGNGSESLALRVCDFFDLQAFLRHLSLLFSVPARKHIQKSHKLSAFP
jgi:succinate dehydrogenase/fumarate reductase cytochrome b subunit (b558 family)